MTNREAMVVVDGRHHALSGRLRRPVGLFDGTINEEPVAVQVRGTGHDIALTRGSHRLAAKILPARFGPMLSLMPPAAEGAGADEIVAPMPGQITRILVEVGDEVQAGQDVAIIEAMKMENHLRAAEDGVVTEVLATVGSQVEKDTLLIVIDDGSEGDDDD